MSAPATKLLADAARELGNEAVAAAHVGDYKIASTWSGLALKASALLGEAVSLKSRAASSGAAREPQQP